MNPSEFPFAPETKSQKIGEGSFVKETYLNKKAGVIVKEYQREHLENLNGNLKQIHTSNTRIKYFVPNAIVILGKNKEGVARAYLAMNYIDGTEITEIETLSEKQMKQLDEFLLTCFQFAEETGEFPDILDACTGDEDTMFTNIIVGVAKNEEEQEVYLVDIWPNKSVEWIGISSFTSGVRSAIANLELHTAQDVCPNTKAYLHNL